MGPIVAASLVLSSEYSSWQEFGFLIVFLTLVAVAAAAGVGARPSRLIALLSRTMNTSTQLPIRLALLFLAGLVTLSEGFGFEGIFGAFAAGLVVGLATRGEAGEPLRVKIDAICFGWFMPFFFIGTGPQWDLGVLTRDAASLLLMPTSLVLLLVVRGLPAFLYRNDIPRPQLLRFCAFQVGGLAGACRRDHPGWVESEVHELCGRPSVDCGRIDVDPDIPNARRSAVVQNRTGSIGGRFA